VENAVVRCKVMGHCAVSCAKTGEPIDMPFWIKTRVGPRNHVLGGGADPPKGRSNFRGLSCPCHSKALEIFARRCKKDHSIANNVMLQKESLSLSVPGKRKQYFENFRAHAMQHIGREGVVGLHSAGEV